MLRRPLKTNRKKQISNKEFWIWELQLFVTIKTKDGCFDEFYDKTKEELTSTRQSKGCKSILISTDRDANTIKMVQFWDDEASFDAYSEKRIERSGADFERLLVAPPVKGICLTENFGYEH